MKGYGEKWDLQWHSAEPAGQTCPWLKVEGASVVGLVVGEL